MKDLIHSCRKKKNRLEVNGPYLNIKGNELLIVVEDE
jgi:hypothetical protein